MKKRRYHSDGTVSKIQYQNRRKIKTRICILIVSFSSLEKLEDVKGGHHQTVGEYNDQKKDNMNTMNSQ
jgi:hypothetical protein